MKNLVSIIASLLFCQVLFAQERNPITADQALERLKEGNRRFVEGKTIHPRQDPTRIREVAKRGSKRAKAICHHCRLLR